MALNGSGPISLGGATSGQSINLELGQSATAQVSLNDAAVRSLAGVSSGAIIMPTNFYGKSSLSYVARTSGTTSSLAFVRFLNSQFVAPATSSLRVLTSSNGITWSSTNVVTAYGVGAADMAYGAGVYVMVAGDGVYSSTDLANWTLRLANSTFGSSNFVVGIARNSSVFVVSTNTSSVGVSTDGITWDVRPTAAGISTTGDGVFSDGSIIVNVADLSTKVQTSSNGTTWTTRYTASGSIGSTGAWTGTTFVIPDNNETIVSTNGTSWSAGGSVGANILTSVTSVAAGANTKVLALGASTGTSYGSTDTGSTWTSYSIPGGATANGVAYGAGVFVVVGNSGNIWTLAL